MGDLRTLCPTMVGRASALASIGEAVAAVRVGAGSAILIAGEAGIGKSRILAEARSLAQGLGFAVVQGSCFEPDRTVPYAPVLDLLDVASGISVVEPASQPGALDHELLGRIPELALLLPDLASMPPPEPGQEQRQLFRALTRFLQRLASQQPMMIAVEDVHWSDDASLAFFGHFAREISGQPILLVLTYRSEEMGPELQHLLAAMDRERLAVELQLDPLTHDGTRDMLQAILGTDRQVPPTLLERIHSLTEGNPFFVEEVLKSLVGSGDIGQLDMSGDLEGHVPIPRTVQDAVQRRTGQLRRATRETLALAAVAGRRFDFELLATLERGDEQELLQEMRELIGAQLVVEVSAEQFAFRHALTRHAIYSELLARERRRLHGRVAEAIERGFQDSLDRYRADLARHFFAAGVWDKAFEQARLAGEQAVDLYAPQAAIEHFTCALEAASHLGMTGPVEIHRARGQAHETLGDFEKSRADFEETLRLTRGAGDRQGEWRALLDLGELWASRDFARSGQYCERALELARAIGEPAAQARSLNRVGNWYVNVEQPVVGRRHHEEALTIFETLADQRGLAETVDLLGTALMCGGDLGASIASYERAAALFRALDDRYRLVLSVGLLAARAGDYHFDPLLFDRAGYARAVDEGDEALALTRKIQWRSGEAFVSSQLGVTCGAHGDYGRALEAVRAGWRIAEEISHPQRLAFAHTALGELYLDLLALPLARHHLEQALELARETNSLIWSNMAGAALVRTCVQQAQLERAEVFLAARPDPPGPPGSFTQRLVSCARVELALARGQPKLALELADELERSLDPSPGDTDRRVGPPHARRLRARVLAALGQPMEAESLLRTEREAAAAAYVLPQLWRIHLALGQLWRAQGRADDSDRELSAARRAVEELAVRLPNEPIEALDGRSLRENLLRSAIPDERPPGEAAATRRRTAANLTPREVEVLRLLASDRSDREIAVELVISLRTVEHHVSSILAKMGVRRRSGATAYALRHGLISPDDLHR